MDCNGSHRNSGGHCARAQRKATSNKALPKSPVEITNKNAQRVDSSFQNPSQEGREQGSDRQEMPHRLAGYSERTAGQGKLACLRVW